ncbi:MAG: 50S ribosomal protein L21 [Candidatus Yanofskybacteria bacterium RIFCSPHIGHO2_02_FULL_43_15c]|uniref:Large ribosomal subunit protein bL21 n=1 Tax=Candidatus Yanofskybacteria bacterium RIFCSPHIGHO2_02_FULL_43_15c TaxID=1802679 RepID=A0A1F8FHA5_9BACT|nr:MAG: 50S ribosomal protein L21 [Candidatus Yanofskybacteria bacterium RIFCSPHIGHO2_02_FULL_43_15c]
MSFAVIKTGGKQYRVSEGDKLLIEKITTPAGEEFDFEEVLLVVPVPKLSSVENESQEIKIGQPLVEGAKVRAKVLAHQRAGKKIVFKYHSKTRYKKKKGHRQPQTKVEILKVIL